MSNKPFIVYVAARGFEGELQEELELAGVQVREVRERLVLADGFFPAAWAQNIWLEPFFLPIASVGDAVRRLKAVQRNWHLHPVDFHRRAELIRQQLPPVKARPLRFGESAPASPLGAWTLWDHDTLLLSARCSSPFPDGEVFFEEDRVHPPSRAYLKLWEVFTLLGQAPQPGELCLDLGSAPGGWTWVLASLGAHVFSIDKSPLAPQVAAMKGVEHCLGSGFALEPQTTGRVDWVFSDMACYPERLLGLVRKWLEAEAAANFVCTVKLQGRTDHEAVQDFRSIPGSLVMHLSCNKHELTWVRLAKGRQQRI
ncbi:SAM-dependent methyltransferase [uncultured Mailhella sp.]|uniref:SAM-dependent methyltransferase n=1 Tax=uncultured Mailhella sp. TaxID=1981031 RepID=UPI002605BF78|nr:SAM-dependent methyltransferase [uncultured Mailhella sp.]